MHGDGLIVAWYLPPDLARELAVPDGEPPEELHLTLVYLGDAEDYDVDLVMAVVKIFSNRWCWPIPGMIGGVGRFVGEADQDVIVALADVPELEHFRSCLWDEFMCNSVFMEGLPMSEHGFQPHITLAYVPKGTSSPPPLTEALEFQIDALTVAAGGSTITFPFPDRGMSGEDVAPHYYTSRERPVTRVEIQTEPVAEYVVTKAVEEERYTLGPLYAPDRLDAHDEYADAVDLQRAVWGYVRESADKGRRLYRQHDAGPDSQTVGEWVEVMAWPYEHTIKVSVPGQDERSLVMPAGTVYMGVIWSEDTWPLVKSGEIAGLSLGGRAVRVSAPGAASMGSMGDKLAMAMHEYVDKDGVCERCGETYDKGVHFSGSRKVSDNAALLLRAVTAALDETEKQHREDQERDRVEREESRKMLASVLEAWSKQAERPLPDTHIHLPQPPDVVINETIADDDADEPD
jgi:2'-5' RNA ligase